MVDLAKNCLHTIKLPNGQKPLDWWLTPPSSSNPLGNHKKPDKGYDLCSKAGAIPINND